MAEARQSGQEETPSPSYLLAFPQLRNAENAPPEGPDPRARSTLADIARRRAISLPVGFENRVCILPPRVVGSKIRARVGGLPGVVGKRDIRALRFHHG